MDQLEELKSVVRGLDVKSLELASLTREQSSCPVIHTYGPGIYIREVRLPKGSFCIGHSQRFAQLNVFLVGRIKMLSPDGSSSEISAPTIFTGPPGQKMGYVVEESVWLNIYSTNETEVGKLERMYLEKSPIWDKLEGEDRSADHADYSAFLNEFGLSDEEVRLQAEKEDDLIPMPYGSFKGGIYPSDIEGKGFFATADIGENEIIAPARLQGYRTPVGRYTNHGSNPNAIMVKFDNGIYLVSTRSIKGSLGGQKGEEITTDYRENRRLLCQE